MEPTACRNPQCPGVNKLYDSMSLVCWAVLVLLAFNTVWDYGIAWDEWFRWQGGDRKLEYYQTLVSGDFVRAAELREANDSYPGLFDLSGALLRGISPFGPVETTHLLSTAFGLAGLAGAWLLARLLGGPAAAFWALLFLALTPRYWGHMFFNPKDIPFAATYVWGLATLVWALQRGQRPVPVTAAAFGIAAGLCMATRIGGLLLLCYGLLFSALQALRNWAQAGFSTTTALLETRHRLGWWVLAAAIAFLILLPWWPRAHQNPFAAASGAVGQVSDFGWQGTVLFMGAEIPFTEIPYYYLPVWLGISLPEWQWVLLALATAFFLAALPRRVRAGMAAGPGVDAGYPVAVFACLFPLVYIMVRGSTVYDGMRHVLFLLPLLACFCACAWARVLACAGSRGRGWLALVLCAGLLPMAGTAVSMYRLHPYQYIYFNGLTGGTGGAYQNFELDYWGTAYREAARELEYFLQDTEPDWRSRNWTVAIVPPLQALLARSHKAVVPPPVVIAYYLPPNIHLIGGDDDPDFYVAMTRFGYPRMMDGEIIAVVERAGAPLAIIRDRRKPVAGVW